METVFRAAFIYFFLLLIFRVAGRKALTNTTTADLVVLLIVSETVQEAMVQNDSSVTTAVILVTTLVSLEVLFLILKVRFPFVDWILEGHPLQVIKAGVINRELLKRLHIEEEDILEAARRNSELDSLDKIESAVVEKNGDISIIPKGKC